jgi:hypothetical protein
MQPILQRMLHEDVVLERRLSHDMAVCNYQLQRHVVHIHIQRRRE